MHFFYRFNIRIDNHHPYSKVTYPVDRLPRRFLQNIHPSFTEFLPLVLEYKNWEFSYFALGDPKA